MAFKTKENTVVSMLKVCTLCETRKNTRSNFRWMPTKGAFHPWCKACEREEQRARQVKVK